MKNRLKGKSVKTKRDKVQAYDTVQLECSKCYWEGTDTDCKKIDSLCVCPKCETVLDSYEEWDYRL